MSDLQCPARVFLARHGQTEYETENLMDRGRTFAHTGPGISLMTNDPGMKVDPARLPCLRAGNLEQGDGSTEAACRSEMSCRGQPFRGRVRRQTGRSKGHGSLLPAGQRFLPAALQLKHRGQPAMSGSEPREITVTPPSVGNLTPGRDGFGQVTSQLGITGQTFQYVEAAGLVVPIGP